MSVAGREGREHDKRIRAEVLAACINATCALCRAGEKPYLQSFGGKNWEGRYQAWVHDMKIEGRVEVQTCPADAMHSLQPAAKDLEELLDKAHEAALPHAAEQLFKALTEGGEFAVGSPLDKAKKRVEELRSRSYRDGATGAAVWFVKLLHGHPEDPPQMGCKPEAIVEKLEELLREERLDEARLWQSKCLPDYPPQPSAWGPQRISELEKARASEGKG
jgi:hypothetical protein